MAINIDILPKDILGEVFLHLDTPEDFRNCVMVNKLFYSIILDEKFLETKLRSNLILKGELLEGQTAAHWLADKIIRSEDAMLKSIKKFIYQVPSKKLASMTISAPNGNSVQILFLSQKAYDPNMLPSRSNLDFVTNEVFPLSKDNSWYRWQNQLGVFPSDEGHSYSNVTISANQGPQMLKIQEKIHEINKSHAHLLFKRMGKNVLIMIIAIGILGCAALIGLTQLNKYVL